MAVFFTVEFSVMLGGAVRDCGICSVVPEAWDVSIVVLVILAVKFTGMLVDSVFAGIANSVAPGETL